MSVHQLKDGRWICRFKKSTIPDDPSRTRYYFPRGPEGEAAAIAKNGELEIRDWKRRTPQLKSYAFTEIFHLYIAAKHAAGDIEDSTLSNMIIKMDRNILPEIGNIPAIDLTKAHLDKYVSKRLQTVKRTTVHRELSDVQAVLNWAVNHEPPYLSINPVARHKKPTRDDAIIRPPDQSEVKAIIREAPNHLKRYLVISYFTGIRPGKEELSHVSWDDVSWSAETILIRSAKKGGLRQREIYIHDEFMECLNSWYEEDRKVKPFPVLIIRWEGRAVGSIKTSWKRAKAKAGITRKLRPYDIRHAFVTEMIRGGTDIKTVSETVGHTRVDTTARIYQHVSAGMKRDAIKRLPGLITVRKPDSVTTESD